MHRAWSLFGKGLRCTFLVPANFEHAKHVWANGREKTPARRMSVEVYVFKNYVGMPPLVFLHS